MSPPRLQRGDPDSSLRLFLIADVRGYTSFTQAHGDAAAARLAMTFAEVAREAVAARGGRVIELRGDEALAVFASASQAVRAAVELQAACQEEMHAQLDLPLRVGVGIDAGEAIPVEGGYRGAAINMAARLCSQAAAGEVLVTRTVAELAGDARGDFSFVDRGKASFKGIEQPVDVIEAVSVPLELHLVEPAVQVEVGLELGIPLVGRMDELHWLRGAWRLARRGRGRVLFLSGVEGIGKTRLAEELAGGAAQAGGEVLRAAGGGAAGANAAAAVKAAAAATRPTLVVLDDLDPVGELAGGELGAAFDEIERRPVLVLVLAREPKRFPALAQVLARADTLLDGHRRLSPLVGAAVEEIARLYGGEDVQDVPVESIMRASKGVPARVHEVLGEWARDEASRRLAAAAEWLAEGKSRRAVGLEFANNVIRMRLDRMFEGAEDAADWEECPYMGLASFEEADADSFFGREQLVGELAARTAAAGLLGVVGASGSGKSSVVRAGLLPSLSAGILPGSGRWRHAVIRPGENPLAALGSLTTREAERLVLVVDQFEEVFSVCPDENERAGFIAELVRLAADPGRCIVVLTIRDDFYGRCAAYADLAELLAANHVLVAPLSREELRRAIELPARRAGIRVESTLVDALVEETAEEHGGLPLLSTALAELWDTRSAGWIRLEAYEQTGGMRGAVARLAEESFSPLVGHEREAARAVLLRLTGGGADGEAVTRRRVQISEFDLESDPAAAAIVSRFTEDRLLTARGGTVEVAHEALLRHWPRLRDWLDEDAEGGRLRVHLTGAAKQWDESGRETSELYRGPRLSATLEWATLRGRELNQLERDFLVESRDHGEREAERQRRINHRLRGLLSGAAVLLLAAIASGSIALVQRSHARRSATAALAQRVGAQALTVVPPDQSFLYARESYNLEPSPATRGYLFAAQARSSQAIAVASPLPGRIRYTQASPDRRRQLILSNTNGAAVVDSQTLATVRTFSVAPGGVVAWSGSNAVMYTDAVSRKTGFLDLRTGRFTADPRLPASAYSVSGDGKTLFTLPVAGTSIGVVDLKTMRLERRIEPATGTVFADVEPAQGGIVIAVEAPAGSPAAPTLYAVWMHGVAGAPTKVISGAPGLPPFVPYTVGGGRFAVPWLRGIRLVDLKTGALSTIDPDVGALSNLGLSPDGRMLVIATLIHSGVTVVSLPDGSPIETFVGHQSQVHGVSFNTAGSVAFTGGADGRLIAWDLRGTRSLAATTALPGSGPRQNEAFPDGRYIAATADGRLVATVNGDGTVDILRGTARTLTVARAIRVGAAGASGQPFSVALDSRGDRLAVGTDDGHVLVYDAPTWNLAKRLTAPARRGPPAPISSIAFSPGGDTLSAAVADGRVLQFAVPSWRALREVALAPPSAAASTALTWVGYSSDGARFAAGVTSGSKGTVEVFDSKTGAKDYAIDNGTDATVAAFAPDGRTLVTGDGEGLGRFWNAATGASEGSPVQMDEGVVNSLTIDATGRTILAAGSDGATWLFDLATRTQIGTPLGANPNTTTAALFLGSDDAAPLALAVPNSGTSPATLTRWNLEARFLSARACQVARRNLTRVEWQQILPNVPYAKVCPRFPLPHS